MASAQAVTELLSEAGRRPPTENPYIFFQSAIDKRAGLQVDNTFYRVIWCDVAFLAISIICYALAMSIRFRRSSLWFFKLVDTSGGRILTLNTTNVFSVISLCYAIFAIPSNVLMVGTYKGTDGISRRDAHQWFDPIHWTLTVLVIVVEIHGIAVFQLLAAGPSVQNLLTRGRWCIPLWHSALGMAYALVILGISIPYIFSSYWYAQAMQALKDFKSQVAVTSRSWQVGQPFAIDPRWFSTLTKLDVFETMTKANKAAHQSYLAVALTVTLLFIPICAMYGRTLQKQIRHLRGLDTSSKQSGQIRRLQHSYYTIIVELVLILAAATAYSVVNGLWVYRYERIIADTSFTGLLLGIKLSVYPFFSFFISIALLSRALLGHQDQGKAGYISREATQGSSLIPVRIQYPSVPLHHLGSASLDPSARDKETSIQKEDWA